MGSQRLKIVFTAAFLGLAAIPFVLGNQYVFHVLIVAGVYVVLAISLNLLLGCAGLFSLGHAAFYGIGAYASALLSMKLHWPFMAAFVMSGVFTAIIGGIVAFPALRLKGIFLAIGTMAFNEIVRLLAINLEEVTGGPAGLPGIVKPAIFGLTLAQPRDYYLAMLVFAGITYVIFQRILAARPGRALAAIRDDEIAARSMGINVTGYKVAAFVMASFFAGLAGSFFAHYMTYISPDNFGLSESFAILAMVALGGIGSMTGSVVGAVVLSAVPEAFRFLQDYRQLIYGVTIVVIMLALPEGAAGWYPQMVRREKRRPADDKPQAKAEV
ncbi:MAG: branched-chain amino acid ABC transporter permease [Negativicutes bacterium]|nr:branched-chain amino acid ABC transporter permease [Negativicutes bacterium]